MMHPKVAGRNCEHCREWQYDEKTGEVEIGRDGEPVRRIGKVPCDASIGCPKGHWSAPKARALTESEDMLIALYHASKATGGAILNEHERTDNVLVLLFAYLERIHQARNTNEFASTMAATMVRLKGI